ncbi:MAG TPA: cupin domain-containing protein [Steroidobacteraceae bacterium]|nr:cupin domain-containing protein [Steroidobacteraceae bacterium]
MDSASHWIERLRLQPHPEGGWYREVHRAAERVQTARGPRSALTTIYYLLEQAQLSRWHVVESDEVWHFYRGAPLELLAYDPRSRALRRTMLGANGESIGVIEAGVWQAARSCGAYSLVGCTVGPGFDFADFRFVATIADHREHFSGELARYAELL